MLNFLNRMFYSSVQSVSNSNRLKNQINLAKFINRTYVYIDTVNGWKCLHQNWKLINSSNICGMVFDIGILGFLILQIFYHFTMSFILIDSTKY